MNWGTGIGGTVTYLPYSYVSYYGIGAVINGDSLTSVSVVKISSKSLSSFSPHTTWVSASDSAKKESKYTFYYVAIGY